MIEPPKNGIRYPDSWYTIRTSSRPAAGRGAGVWPYLGDWKLQQPRHPTQGDTMTDYYHNGGTATAFTTTI